MHPEVGDIVRVDITHYPDRDFPEVLQGLVTEIIGKATDTGIDVLEVLESLVFHHHSQKTSSLKLMLFQMKSKKKISSIVLTIVMKLIFTIDMVMRKTWMMPFISKSRITAH